MVLPPVRSRLRFLIFVEFALAFASVLLFALLFALCVRFGWFGGGVEGNGDTYVYLEGMNEARNSLIEMS